MKVAVGFSPRAMAVGQASRVDDMVNWQAALLGATYQYMNTIQSLSNTKSAQNQPTTTVCDTLKVGLDVHAAFVVAAWQMDGSVPKAPQKFSPEKFVHWIGQQVSSCKKVVCCYEAGPTGFNLHRQLVARGVTSLVVCPTCLDSRHKGVNNDQRDALELLSRLDRYLAGNPKAFSVVRVPTEQQEQRRVLPRQREQLRATRLSLASMGRSLMLLNGERQSNHWWKAGCWLTLQRRLPSWIVERLGVFHQVILSIEEQIKGLDKAIKARAAQERPKGLGPLGHEQIESEVCDWKRFETRRQIGGYAGLSGGVSASGEQFADLSITKVGNKRLRTWLIELAWRMLLYQPDYWLVKKWAKVLLDRKAHARCRKRAIVAFARQLLIDLWKWKTGRATPQSLGWVMS